MTSPSRLVKSPPSMKAMTSPSMNQDGLVGLYRSMFLIRRFEERADHLRQQGFIPGFLYPYIGQEAVAVGVCAALEDGDVITSTHRGHGHMLARGADPARMYAELYGRQVGDNRAKGGSLHMIDVALGFLGANGIVGGGIPLATGAALQKKWEGQGRVAVSFFGDGASMSRSSTLGSGASLGTTRPLLPDGSHAQPGRHPS